MLPVIRTGLSASMQEIAVLTNNISNANSTGFKRSQTEFADIYGATGDGKNLGLGARIMDPRRQHGQGAFKQTGGSLDVAITGPGMFAIQNKLVSDEPLYTRNGSMSLDLEGKLINQDNASYLDQNGNPIVVPFGVEKDDGSVANLSEVQVLADGQIVASYGPQITLNIAKIGLVQFNDVTKLQAQGSNVFSETDASGEARIGGAFENGAGSFQAGALEASNVDMTSEMNFLIRAQQAFNGTSRLMQSEAEMVRRLIG